MRFNAGVELRRIRSEPPRPYHLDFKNLPEWDPSAPAPKMNSKQKQRAKQRKRKRKATDIASNDRKYDMRIGPELPPVWLNPRNNNWVCFHFSERAIARNLRLFRSDSYAKRCYHYLEAIRQAQRRSEPAFVYLCPSGEHWHLSRQPDPTPLSDEMRKHQNG